MKKYPRLERPDLVRPLIAAGCPLELEGGALDNAPSAGSGLLIHQVGGVTESLVFDLDDGGTGYILSVAIINKLPGPVCIQDYHLELPWDDPHFRWLEDPPAGAPQRYLYCFPGMRALEFERDVVINGCRWKRTKAWLQPDRCIEGLLLGTGREPIPDQYKHGCFVDMELLVFGAGSCFWSTVWVWVKRTGRSVKLNQRPLRGRARRKLIVRDAEGTDSIMGARAPGEG